MIHFVHVPIGIKLLSYGNGLNPMAGNSLSMRIAVFVQLRFWILRRENDYEQCHLIPLFKNDLVPFESLHLIDLIDLFNIPFYQVKITIFFNLVEISIIMISTYLDTL